MDRRQELINALLDEINEWDEDKLREYARDARANNLRGIKTSDLEVLYTSYVERKEQERREEIEAEEKAERELVRYRESMEKIDNRITSACEAIGDKCVLHYSVYEEAEDGSAIDNLDEVAVEGTVRFVAPRDEYWGGDNSQRYESPEVTNPTWLQVAVFANASILATNDHHHVFLEGVGKVIDGVSMLQFGS